MPLTQSQRTIAKEWADRTGVLRQPCFCDTPDFIIGETLYGTPFADAQGNVDTNSGPVEMAVTILLRCRTCGHIIHYDAKTVGLI